MRIDGLASSYLIKLGEGKTGYAPIKFLINVLLLLLISDNIEAWKK